MTNDNPKCEHEFEGAWECKKCGQTMYWNGKNPIEFKPLPSEPSCEHSDYNKWAYHEEQDGGIYILQYVYKDKYPRCPFCKPVEPSCEEIAEEIMIKHGYDHTHGLDYHAPDLFKAIAEALRNERNRK